MSKGDPYVAIAFGQGSNARILGTEICDNPYKANSERPLDYSLWAAWRRGWLHVHRQWGIKSKNAIRKLPKVKDPDATKI